MPWDGNGNFTRDHNWQSDRDSAIKILASRHDEEDDNLAEGIAACLTKNGETKPTATFSPNSTRSYDLGSTSARWRSLYLGTSVNIQSATASAAHTLSFTDATVARTITIPDAAGTVLLAPASTPVSFTYGIGSNYIQNASLTASVAASALTIALKGKDGNDPSATNPVEIAFRNATVGTGDYSILQITAATSLVVSSGSTLGTVSALAHRLYVVGINDAGTFRLGIYNPYNPTGPVLLGLDEGQLYSSTAEGGAGSADSAQVIYTGTSVTSKAIRILGYIESTQGTAGTWATTPSKIQLMGPGVRRTGDIVQSPFVFDGSTATGSTVMPGDNTIPQVGEGDQYMSRSITPTSAINLLDIQACFNGSCAASASTMVAALFQDANANALRAADFTHGVAEELFQVNLHHVMVAGTTSSTNINLRAGRVTAGTTRFNGAAGSQRYGGVYGSYIKVSEIFV